MSEFILKTAQEWHSIEEKLPEIGKQVEVLCTMITKASLLSTDPKQMWNQEQDISEALTEVKLWRECEPTQEIPGI